MLDVLQAGGLRRSSTRPGIGGLCCGMPFASKAFPEAAARRASRARPRRCGRRPREGRRPRRHRRLALRGHAAASSRRRTSRQTGAPLRIHDFPTFWAREVLPRLGRPRRRPGRAVLHPTCTLVKTGGLPDLLRGRARAHARRSSCPPGAECCGFAGDRGFLVPELTAGRHRARGGGGARPLDADARRPLLDLPHLRDRDVARGRASVSLARPPRARGARSVVDALPRLGGRSCPALPVYVVLMALSALENVFPPVPADVAVVLGAFLAQRGLASAPAPRRALLARQHRLVGGACTSTPARTAARFFATGWRRKLMPPEAIAGAREGLRAARRLRHLLEPLPARRARGGDAVRGRRRACRPARALLPAAARLRDLVRVPGRRRHALGLNWDARPGARRRREPRAGRSSPARRWPSSASGSGGGAAAAASDASRRSCRERRPPICADARARRVGEPAVEPGVRSRSCSCACISRRTRPRAGRPW